MHISFVYGTAWKEERTAALTGLALQAGFRAIDTANQRKHYFEAAVGEALQSAYDSGLVTRGDLFLQTKFTYVEGQDHRLPFDSNATLTQQVAQSMTSSLEHLRTDYVDSYVLHGPASGYGWSEDDAESWDAMVRERASGRARALGVSNVSLRHLEQMPEHPNYVQNRCFARLGWDRAVRAFCREHGIVYQGFSLLTANRGAMNDPSITQLAAHYAATPAQILFAFARAIGILPLTGTSSPEHMQQDVASLTLELEPAHVAQIERIAG